MATRAGDTGTIDGVLTRLEAMENDATREPVAPTVERGDYTVPVSARELAAIIRQLKRHEAALVTGGLL